jgi:AcrR family transcriptional regulator
MVARMTKGANGGNGLDASASLIAAAEQLFADRGIDGVSLREINREARQRNTTSLQYHFGDREGLLRAILAKHGREVHARRNALLDQYEANGVDDVRALASAFVLPLVAKLHDPEGGRGYLRIAAELVNRTTREITPDEPSILSDPLGRDPRDSITRWSRLVAPLVDPIAVGPPLHRRFAAMRFAHIELGRRASERPHQSDRLFTSHLVDLVISLLVTPVSDETRALLEQRSLQRAARTTRRTRTAPAAPAAN